MSSPRFAFAVLILVPWLLGATAARADLVIDQEQTALDPAAGGWAIGGSAEQVLGQTFVSARGGWLGAVELAASCPPWSADGYVTVEIQSVDPATGAPGDVVLAAVTIAGSALQGELGTWRSFPLSGLLLEAGTAYAIVVRGDPLHECAMTRSPDADTYPDGESWFQALPNPPGWILNGYGFDNAFRVLVDDGTGPGSGSPYCRFVAADGFPNDWLPRHVPVCRCLEDETLAANRCFFELPDLVVIRELPWAGESWIDARWSVVPLGDDVPLVLVSLESLSGTLEGPAVEFKQGGKPLKSELRSGAYQIDGTAALDHLRVRIEAGPGLAVFEDRRSPQ